MSNLINEIIKTDTFWIIVVAIIMYWSLLLICYWIGCRYYGIPTDPKKNVYNYRD